MQVSVGSFATAGARGEDRMEDRHVVWSPVDPAFPDGHVLAVFDGHRGPEAADFAAQSLQATLARTAAEEVSGEACLKVCNLASLHCIAFESWTTPSDVL